VSLKEKIIRYVEELPESKQAEVLDFVEYLSTKLEEKSWGEFSLSSAMRGMEDEEPPHKLDDLKESFQ
jgi:hypothetical protein